VDRSALAERSRQVEVEDLHVAGGRQDHYAAAYGGALALTFGRTTAVQRIEMPPALSASLARRCIVGYTGESRISGDTITAVLEAYRNRDPRVVNALERMKALARQMAESLAGANVDELGALVGEHWQHQRSLHPSIPTPLIDEILARANRAGAKGGKALGASGGGCVLAIAGEDSVDAVRAAIAPFASLQPVAIDDAGFTATIEA
jgi:D-glycero-alpha-D-manno-heptose-7-phosphate kinase